MSKRKGSQLPNTHSETKDRAKELFALFNNVEMLMKKIELEYDDKFFAPALNEIRYAFFDYFTYQIQNDETAYVEAKRHIQRAIDDAKEFIINTFLVRIRDFEKAYQSVIISNIIKDWIEIRKELNRINKSLTEHNKEWKENSVAFDKEYKYLLNVMDIIDAAIPELNKLRLSDFLIKKMPIIIGIIGIFVTIYAIVTA
jgi:hypothetical protein